MTDVKYQLINQSRSIRLCYFTWKFL